MNRKQKISLINQLLRGEVTADSLRPKNYTIITHQDKGIEYRAEGQPAQSNTFWRDLYSAIGGPLNFQIVNG